MNKNIFECRELRDTSDEILLSTNLDEFGRFYGQGVYVRNKFEADNPEWLLNNLFPALQQFVHENDDKLLLELNDDFVNKLSRYEKAVIYEMLTTALALGWFVKENL